LPQKDAQIVVSIQDAMPGATLRAHNHPYPRYVYVLSGNLQVNNIETGQTVTYKPGNFILESVGQWQTVASIGSEPLKLLVIDIVEHGQSNTVQLDWSGVCAYFNNIDHLVEGAGIVGSTEHYATAARRGVAVTVDESMRWIKQNCKLQFGAGPDSRSVAGHIAVCRLVPRA
jgi:quercetin dioxygenase-like cupin family protein